ncbi:MAG TPA: Gfo/Idh/MocA family oxidoreductase [Candidatus Acidoferrum sp.]|nr:Gfo/Idh/MocA family oxidoreductase [Candidatus Acidoferrum sp.]
MLRGAIIGFGKIAQTGHWPALSSDSLRSEIEITAVVEPDVAYQTKAREMIAGVRVYDNLESLRRHERPDFVDICTPPFLHAATIISCAQSGMHILCEKPFGTSVADISPAAAVLRSRPELVFMPCHQYRYSPVWRPFKEFIDSSHNNTQHLAQFNVYRTQADPGYLTSNPHWRTDRRLSGGGILADTGVHYLYMTLWLLGKPKSVYASTRRLSHGQLAVEDTAVVIIEAERGLAEITLTWGGDRRANSARLVSREGSLAYDGTRLERFTDKGGEILPVPDASDKTQYVRLYVSLFEEFIARIESRRSSSDWIDEAYDSIMLLDACYRSAESHAAVMLDAAEYVTGSRPTALHG